MKKRIIGLVLAGTAALTLASCGESSAAETTTVAPVDTTTQTVAPVDTTTQTVAPVDTTTQESSSDVFNIYCWNTEFQGYFNEYVSDEAVALAKEGKTTAEIVEALKDTKTYHLDGKEVVWTQVTSDGGAYQKALDEALLNNATAKDSQKVDMFLAEADYILKYTNSKYTKDISSLGIDNSQSYGYTVSAASDANGVQKGVSFQCCPSGMVYRTDIAKEVLGVDTPEEMQALVSTWEDYDKVAAKMKDAGYLMTGSYADSYRVFSNNATAPWVTNNTVKIPTVVETWMTQAETYVKNGYTLTEGVWDAGKTAEFAEGGKAFCTFGPAWYYNFCMGTAMGEGDEHTGGTYGLWNVIKGPQAHFWGGTWILAAEGGNDDALVAKVMKAFTTDHDVCYKLVSEQGQFSNNKAVNEEYAATGKGNAFLGGQNDTQIWCDMADDIKFENNTIYDQLCNEGLQNEFVKYLKGEVDTKQAAIDNFYSYIIEQYPALDIE